MIKNYLCRICYNAPICKWFETLELIPDSVVVDMRSCPFLIKDVPEQNTKQPYGYSFDDLILECKKETYEN